MKEKSRVIVLIENLCSKINEYKEENMRLKADNECLKRILQRKRAFEVRA